MHVHTHTHGHAMHVCLYSASYTQDNGAHSKRYQLYNLELFERRIKVSFTAAGLWNTNHTGVIRNSNLLHRLAFVEICVVD